MEEETSEFYYGNIYTREPSDSNSATDTCPPVKRAKLTQKASRFKGVVPQHNGHWGCQIYDCHQRIWLGTFNSEKEAATAYDSAAMKLRGGGFQRNFPATSFTFLESKFQSFFSTRAILDMIKDGTYRPKYNAFLKTQSSHFEAPPTLDLCKPRFFTGFVLRHLFEKELTPSDVGKLNRLVIPKKYAVQYFPHVSEEDDGGDVQLVFYDTTMRPWNFRYCYWSSSQSFVFTRGWSRFVKDKKLRYNDIVVFSLCKCEEESEIVESRTFVLIDVKKPESFPEKADRLPIKGDDPRFQSKELHEVTDQCSTEEEKENKSFKLFGVDIF